MNKLPVGVLETIEDTIDRWNQFSEVIADEKIKDWPSCIRLKDDMSVVETYIAQLEAKLKLESGRLDKLREYCNVGQFVVIETSRYGFTIGSGLEGKTFREAIDKLEEQDHE